MSELIERLRLEANERRKDPEWFDEEFSQAIVLAADALEAKDALIAELVEALQDALSRLDCHDRGMVEDKELLSKAKP